MLNSLYYKGQIYKFIPTKKSETHKHHIVMKPNQLFKGMLALATVFLASCAAPRMAGQGNTDDDVYNSTAKAKIYTPAPVRSSESTPSATSRSGDYTDEQYQESDYYGTSDPYYDMDYASRINRFYYASPWRTYYDPYFYSGWYPYSSGWSVGIGFGSFYNNYWNYPYSGWGYLYNPFWGFNNWGWNSWGWNNYYGGYFGGGWGYPGYYGGGFYTGRTTNVPDYRPRPGLGRENGIGTYRDGLGRPASGRGAVRTDQNGVVTRRSRAEMYDANENAGTNGRVSNRRTQETTQPAQNSRPTRTESYTPPARQPESRPSYTPPPASRGSSSGSGSSGGGGGTRSGRAGRG